MFPIYLMGPGETYWDNWWLEPSSPVLNDILSDFLTKLSLLNQYRLDTLFDQLMGV